MSKEIITVLEATGVQDGSAVDSLLKDIVLPTPTSSVPLLETSQAHPPKYWELWIFW
ncbi:hypothetical protein HD806DRAFT_478904 [Xylariaceae sp. AK1471]|nr:hypothetical protein HD806DRAFT_478904 [Xylariaceae sp. AK1471]